MQPHHSTSAVTSKRLKDIDIIYNATAVTLLPHSGMNRPVPLGAVRSTNGI